MSASIVYTELIAPLIPLLQEEAGKLKGDRESYNLSFFLFSMNLLFGVLSGVKSISLLITEIKTSRLAKALKLTSASQSMYSEAFNRYPSSVFQSIFNNLTRSLNLVEIPEMQSLGRVFLVDGSIFPAMISMSWASYTKKLNAVKLHLAFEINRMIPVQFVSTKGNASERSVLLQIVEKNVTYILDRGYVAFNVFQSMADKESFFVIRGTSNLIYNIQELLPIMIPSQFSSSFSNLTDSSIIFTNDSSQYIYRLVSFSVFNEKFLLITNRWELTTFEVIMLYAYRWQVELIFRFLKRTLKSLHLMHHDHNGVESQFYLYMIAYLLLLKFKQQNIIDNEKSLESSDVYEVVIDEHPHSDRMLGCGLVTLLGGKLKKYWKISIHWLAALRNLFLEPLTNETSGLIYSVQ